MHGLVPTAHGTPCWCPGLERLLAQQRVYNYMLVGDRAQPHPGSAPAPQAKAGVTLDEESSLAGRWLISGEELLGLAHLSLAKDFLVQLQPLLPKYRAPCVPPLFVRG